MYKEPVVHIHRRRDEEFFGEKISLFFCRLRGDCCFFKFYVDTSALGMITNVIIDGGVTSSVISIITIRYLRQHISALAGRLGHILHLPLQCHALIDSSSCIKMTQPQKSSDLGFMQCTLTEIKVTCDDRNQGKNIIVAAMHVDGNQGYMSEAKGHENIAVKS